MNVKTKTLEFLYQESEIHFLVNPHDKNVMINATEMAKAFEKRMDHFMKSDHAKNFINALLSTPFGGNKIPMRLDEIIKTNKKGGTWMNRLLALKFAAWLDVEFEVWVYSKIDDILFGNYKKHWDAHAAQEAARSKMAELKADMLMHPTKENVSAYFEAESAFNSAKNMKSAAIRNQLKLFKE